MSVPSFGQSARLQAREATDPWLRWAGGIFWYGLLATGIVWWNGLLDPHESLKQWLLGCVLLLAGFPLSVALRRAPGGRPFSWAISGGLAMVLLSAVLSWAFAPDRWLAAFGTAGSISTSLFTWVLAITASVFAASLRALGWAPPLRSLQGTGTALIVCALLQRFGLIDLSPGGPAARLFTPVGNDWALLWAVAALSLATLTQEAMGHLSLSRFDLWLRRLFLLASGAYLLVMDQMPVWILLFLGLGIVVATQRTALRERGAALGMVIAAGSLIACGLLLPIPRPSGLPILAALSPAESWRVVRETWAQGSLLIGAGPGQWSAVFERVRPLALNVGSLFAIRFDVGGAFWWTILLQQGVFAGIAWVLFLLASGFQTVLALREDEDRLPLAVGFWFSALSLFLMQPPAWLLVAIFVAAGFLFARRTETRGESPHLWRLMVLLFSLVLAIFIPFAFQRVRADAALRTVQRATTAEARRTQARLAAERAPWLADNAFTRAEADAAWLDAQIRAGVRDPETFQRELAAAIDRQKAANARWPRDPALWLARGRLYLTLIPVTEGADQFALQAYQEGIGLAPNHPGFPLGMAQVFLLRASALEKQLKEAAPAQEKPLNEARLEQLRLAAQWFRRALERRGDDRSIQYAYALTLARSGDVAGAIPLFEALWKEEPRRADLTLEYATVLAAANETAAAIALAQRVGTQDPLYLTAQRLLVTWYEAERRWPEAVAALRTFPSDEQRTPAFRQRLNRLQSNVTAAPTR